MVDLQNMLMNLWVRVGHTPCEKLVKMRGNDFTITGVSVGLPNAKIEVGAFSNKNVEFYKVNNVLMSMDTSQYLLCQTIESLPHHDPFRLDCMRIRLQTILGFSQLNALLEMKDEERFKDEVEKWIIYMNDLVKVQISTLSSPPPPTPTIDFVEKPNSHFSPEIKSELERIGEYQGIEDEDQFELVLRNSNFG
jgi:hypothetical protein